MRGLDEEGKGTKLMTFTKMDLKMGMVTSFAPVCLSLFVMIQVNE